MHGSAGRGLCFHILFAAAAFLGAAVLRFALDG